MNNITTAKIIALRDVEIQMFKLLEKGEIVSFDNVKKILVSLEGLWRSEEKQPECRYGHQCTSSCQNDIDCPCLEHCCDMNDCECEDGNPDCRFAEEKEGLALLNSKEN